MKKILLLGILLVSVGGKLHAQTIAEWLQQEKTQKQYLLQQIAALKVYTRHVQRGYKIAKEGLTAIGGFTKEEFDLHSNFIQSLKTVNPRIKHYAKVAAIVALQVKIVQDYDHIYRQLRGSPAYSVGERAYIRSVFGRLLDDCAQTLDELMAVTTDATLEMKDDERLKRIDQLFHGMQDKYAFSQSFSNDVRLLATSRVQEQAAIKMSRAWQSIINK